MATTKKILIIGEVYTDNHIDHNLVRLGGIFHSARMLSALGVEFALAAILPSYLKKAFQQYSEKLEVTSFVEFGVVNNTPNVVNIYESKEVGNQGYEDILRNEANILLELEVLEKQIIDFEPTDIIIYPGKYDLKNILNLIYKIGASIKIHIDFQYSTSLEELILLLNNKIETIILSSSSSVFKEAGSTVFDMRTSAVSRLTKNILVKENRGGATLIDTQTMEINEAPAFLSLNQHSVGLGDCYNVAYINFMDEYSKVNALKLASFYSAEYSTTFDFDKFKDNTNAIPVDAIFQLEGVRIPWDVRQNINIYIAGPDFPRLDRSYFEQLEESLKHHNFIPHRPIIKNGLYTGNEEYHIQQKIYNDDINLLEKSDLMIAVLLENDPGTLVEIGWMNKNGKPIILFDPFNLAHNLFLKKSVSCIVKSIDEVIFNVFRLLDTNKNRGVFEYDSLLLMSGGLDSTTLAYDLINQGKKVLPVFLDYGQHFSDKEFSSLMEVIPRRLKSHLRIINISDIYKHSDSSMIVEADLWKQDISAEDLYLPYRNLLFLAIASSIAQSEKIDEVYAAFINSNHAKEIDCSTEFFSKLEDILAEYGSVKILLPYRELEKYEVILKGIELRVPMALTYSCQTNSKIPCGVCPNCVDRENAIFNLNKEFIK